MDTNDAFDNPTREFSNYNRSGFEADGTLSPVRFRAGQPGENSNPIPRRQSRPRSPAEPEPIGSNALPNPAPTVSPHDKQAALALLTQIGTDFASNRQRSKSKAFEIYQRDLATNSGALVMGGAVTLKELTVLLMDLEAYMKSTQKEGETPSTMLAKFLNGELEVDD